MSKQVEEWEKQAQHGDISAAASAAIAYLLGDGVSKDTDKAFEYASKVMFMEDDDEFIRILCAIDELPPDEYENMRRRLNEYGAKIESSDFSGPANP